MEDIEDSGVIAPGSGVIVNCDDGKYIGFLQGTDDIYLYLKTTHRWGEKIPEVTDESAAELRDMLEARPLWLLRTQVAWKYKMVTVGIPRDLAVSLMAEAMEREAVAQVGPVKTFLPEAKAVNMGIPHGSILSFESLQDVISGTVLAELDFTGVMPYNEEDDYDDESSDDESD